MNKLIQLFKPQKKYLVFLHIEKTAGTTFRTEFYKLYGIDKVFWYNIDSPSQSFDPADIRKRKTLLIGGHRLFTFYPQDFAKFYYMALLRDPLSRTLSLYNYFVNLIKNNYKDPSQAHMVADGKFNSNSLLDSLKNSPFFINQIENRQCKYISGTHSAAKTIELIENAPFLIGTQENFDHYANFCKEIFKWPSEKLPIYNCGDENYQSTIDLDSEAIKLIHELTVQDKILHQYVTDKKIIYNPSQWKKIKVFQTHPNQVLPMAPPNFHLNPAEHETGHHKNINSKIFKTKIKIENLENQLIPKGRLSKLYMTHQWYKNNEKYYHSDTRSLLPKDISPRDTIETEISVNLPKEKGEYTLVFTLVQDALAWQLTNIPHDLCLKFRVDVTA